MQKFMFDANTTLLEKYADVSLVDLATNQLRHNIYTGKYKPGQKLVVRELSEELNISHTPIKEALNRLVSEGYVVAQPRKSMIVREYTNQQFIENMQVRFLIELANARDFLDGVQETPAIIEEIGHYQQLQTDLAAQGSIDFEEWIDYGGRFHDAYLKTIKNHQMYETYHSLDTNRGSYFAYLNNTNSSFMMQRIQQDEIAHGAIITAMEQQDLHKLRRALADHILQVCSEYLVDENARRAYLQFQTYLDIFDLK